MDDGARFQEFYCENILKGKFVNNKCNNIPASSCENKMKYDAILEEDFRQFWQNTVNPLIESLDIECSGTDTSSSALYTTALCFIGTISTALLVVGI